MKTIFLSIALLASLPLKAQETAPDASAITFDEAVDCAAISTIMGLVLTDTKRANFAAGDVERGRSYLKLVTPFTSHAQRIGGKSEREVITRVSDTIKTMSQRFAGQKSPRAAMDAMMADCAAKAPVQG